MIVQARYRRWIGGVLAVAMAVGLSAPGFGAGDDPLPQGDCPVTPTLLARPPDDPNADPFGAGPWYVNPDRSIWAGWDAPRMTAGEGGNKVLWIRPAGTQLQISGRRLDGEAEPLTAHVPEGYPTGFQATGLYFPSPGCWEITATAGTSVLVFVTVVH